MFDKPLIGLHFLGGVDLDLARLASDQQSQGTWVVYIHRYRSSLIIFTVLSLDLSNIDHVSKANDIQGRISFKVERKAQDGSADADLSHTKTAIDLAAVSLGTLGNYTAPLDEAESVVKKVIEAELVTQTIAEALTPLQKLLDNFVHAVDGIAEVRHRPPEPV